MSPIGGKTIDLLTVKIGADIDETLKGFDEIKSKVNSFSAGFAGAAAVATAAGAAILGAAVKTGRWADELLDLRDQTNLSLRELQEFRAVAISAGVGADTIAEAVLKMQTRMASGEEGSADLRMGLERLGVSIEDWTGKTRPMGEVVTEIVGKLGDMEDVTTRNVTATKIFGRGAVELLPVLAMGSAEIEKVTDRAHRMGLVMSDESVEAANELRIEFDLAVESLAAMGRELSVQTIPMLLRLGETLAPVLENLKLLTTAASGGPGVAAQGIINSLPDDIGGLQSRYIGFLEMLPESTTAAAMSIDELQARYEELRVTQTDVAHILLVIEERIATLAETTREDVAPSFGDLAERAVQVRISLDELGNITIPRLADVTEEWTEWQEYGRELTLSVRTAQEIYNDELEEADILLRANIIGQETHTRLVEQATAALHAQAAAARADADELGELAGQLGSIGALFSILGVSLPGLGQAASLIGLFAGGFAEGGHIPSGQWGIVGERGPEVVTGPANITPTGGGSAAAIVEQAFRRMPSPPSYASPEALANERYWRIFGAELVEVLRHDGVRFSR